MSSDVSAISTTFTPPATCTQDHLTLMEYYQYQIWLNYPVPVPGTTSTNCYPPQYVSSYFSAQYITTPLPAPTPLVCPVGYGTILSTTLDSSSEYVACCPSSWLLARPTGSSTLSNRPAYGGTCYSDISTVVVTAYDNTSAIATSTWVASVSGQQAYALVIEGYAAANATNNGIFASSTSSSTMQTSTKPAPTTTVFLASSTSTPSTVSHSNKGLSGGAIAGIVIGVLVFVALVAGALFFFLVRKRRQSHAAAASAAAANSAEAGRRTPAGAEMEGDGGAFNDKDDKLQPPYGYPPTATTTDSHTELPGYEAAHEVESPMNRPVEMQGEGYVDSGAAERERAASPGAGPHEMEAGK